MSIRVSKRLLDHSVKKVGNCVEPSNVALSRMEMGTKMTYSVTAISTFSKLTPPEGAGFPPLPPRNDILRWDGLDRVSGKLQRL